MERNLEGDIEEERTQTAKNIDHDKESIHAKRKKKQTKQE